MANSLNEKVVWVIGASSGIGKSLAEEFSSNGSKVIISARRAELLNKISLTSQNILALPLDLTDAENLPKQVDIAISIHGRIDFVIFCGGLSQRTIADSTPLANTRAIMETNFFSSVAITKKLLPIMKKNGGGHFVIISSLMGRFGAQKRSSYSASKHALHGYFESLRAEEWHNHIRVTIAILGYINTEFSKHALTESGEAYGIIDPGQESGMATSICAKKLITGILNEKEEILIGGFEKYSTFLKRFAPTILSKILRNKDIS